MENILFPSYKSFHQLFVDKTKLNMIRKYIWQNFINMYIAHKLKKGFYNYNTVKDSDLNFFWTQKLSAGGLNFGLDS